jgi:hypothetical protein
VLQLHPSCKLIDFVHMHFLSQVRLVLFARAVFERNCLKLRSVMEEYPSVVIRPHAKVMYISSSSSSSSCYNSSSSSSSCYGPINMLPFVHTPR